MVNDSRRYRIHIEISHLIRSHHHSAVLLIECIHNLGQSVRTAVYVVAVKLHRKLSACLIMDSKIPAATDTKVIFLRYKVYKPAVSCSNFFKKFSRSVCRMIIHYDHIERETAVLCKRTFHCIPDCSDTIIYRNNY